MFSMNPTRLSGYPKRHLYLFLGNIAAITYDAPPCSPALHYLGQYAFLMSFINSRSMHQGHGPMYSTSRPD